MQIGRWIQGVIVGLIVFLSGTVANAEECYKYVNDDGVIVYTDSDATVPEKYRDRLRPCATSGPVVRVIKDASETRPATEQPGDVRGQDYWKQRAANAKERVWRAQEDYERLQIEYRRALDGWDSTRSLSKRDEYEKQMRRIKDQMGRQQEEIIKAKEYLEITLPREAQAAGVPVQWVR